MPNDQQPAVRIEMPRAVTLGNLLSIVATVVSASIAVFAIWNRIEISDARQTILIQEIDKRVARIERRFDRVQ